MLLTVQMFIMSFFAINSIYLCFVIGAKIIQKRDIDGEYWIPIIWRESAGCES